MDARVGVPGGRSLWIGLASLVSMLGLAHLVHIHDAPVVLAAAVLLLGLVFLFLWPDVATTVVLFILYTNIAVVASRRLGIPPMIASSFGFLLILPLTRDILFRGRKPRVDRTFLLMLAFLAVLLLSALGADDVGISLERIGTYVFEGVVLYWLVINVVRGSSALRRVIFTLLAAGTLLGSLTLYQSITDTPRQQFWGLAQRNLEKVERDVAHGRVPGDYRHGQRAEGSIGDPNRYAQILLVLLPLALFGYRTERSRRWRLYCAACGLVLLGALLLTYSRGAFVGLGVLAVALLALRWIRLRHAVVGAMCLALAVPLVAPGYVERIRSVGDATDLVWDDPSVRADGAIRGRATEMLAAVHVFLDHPILGVGVGQYAPFYSLEYHQRPELQFRDIKTTRRAHSLYAELAAETGAVGLVTFLAIVVTLLRQLWRARARALREDPALASLATALALGVVAYLTTGVFLQLSYERYYWFLLALASGGAHAVLTEAGAGRSRTKDAREPESRSRARALVAS